MWERRIISDKFNVRPSEQEPMSHTTFGRLLAKYKATGSVGDAKRTGRSNTSEEAAVGVLARLPQGPPLTDP